MSRKKHYVRPKFIVFGLIIITLILTCSAYMHAENSNQSYRPEFIFPIKCNLDKDCLITKYADVDPSSDWHDYKGGRVTDNGHTGTDIALRNIGQMEKGVPVFAAADGTVRAVRNGVRDINIKEIGEGAVRGFECGNAVVINHSNGWQSDYCHLHKGSITVKPGNRVKAGQKIGLVGMSGLAEIPHLHFQVMRLKDPIDPFSGDDLNHSDYPRIIKTPAFSMWKKDTLKKIVYMPGLIYNIGINSNKPNIKNIQSGNFKQEKITSRASGVYFWVDLLHVKKGDIIQFIMSDPAGKNIINKAFTIDKSNVRLFLVLKHNYNGNCKPGEYKATAILHRIPDKFKFSETILFQVVNR